jgi:hypothetical protein
MRARRNGLLRAVASPGTQTTTTYEAKHLTEALYCGTDLLCPANHESG